MPLNAPGEIIDSSIEPPIEANTSTWADRQASRLQFLAKARLVRQLLAMGRSGYLLDSGWVLSFLSKSPVDHEGRAIPWMTLPFVDFIGGRLRSTMRIFEFGCGNSTLFYATRVKTVEAVEHDPTWAERMRSQTPSNVQIIELPLVRGGEYCRAAMRSAVKYDLIVVDGRDRVNCILNAVEALSPGGCLVLDDSERPVYRPGIDALVSASFRRLDFSGVAPGLAYKKCSTVFYRPGNCLEI
ncbi:Methyltransferase domain protein [Rubrivivax sp. A210]|nr:Methyltransferase domain protein [Rubrivivax sp. A210]